MTLSLLYGLPKYQICKPHRVQNTAARHISKTRKYDRISPVLFNLHWLPVFYPINFKILISTFKAIHNMSPSYISIWFASGPALHITPLFSNILRGVCWQRARSFSAARPYIVKLNSLPLHIRGIGSLCAFKGQVKTYLFRLAFK